MKPSRLFLISFILLISTTFAFAAPNESRASQAEIDQVLKFERDWCDAYLHGNVDFLRKHIAPDFTLTGSDGHVDTLAGDIKDIESGTVKYQVFENRDMKPRIYGDTAVVTGWTKVRATINGKPYSTDVAFTDTLTKVDGQWIGLAGHVSKPQK